MVDMCDMSTSGFWAATRLPGCVTGPVKESLEPVAVVAACPVAKVLDEADDRCDWDTRKKTVNRNAAAIRARRKFNISLVVLCGQRGVVGDLKAAVYGVTCRLASGGKAKVARPGK